MTILKEHSNSTLIISIEGRIDTTTAPELEQEINNISNIEELILDFSKVDYISSAGLRVVLNAQKLMNHLGSMKIKNVQEPVLNVFEITGFVDILTIE